MEGPWDYPGEKPDKKPKPRDSKTPSTEAGGDLSRRDCLKISGVGAAATLVAHARVLVAEAQEVPVAVAIQGPGKVPVSLNVNGKKLSAQLEPRVTLLDALRDQFELTGAKRVCDRGTCGACTVLLDVKSVYSCSVLAIDAQSAQIITVERLGDPGHLH